MVYKAHQLAVGNRLCTKKGFPFLVHNLLPTAIVKPHDSLLVVG